MNASAAWARQQQQEALRHLDPGHNCDDPLCTPQGVRLWICDAFAEEIWAEQIEAETFELSLVTACGRLHNESTAKVVPAGQPEVGNLLATTERCPFTAPARNARKGALE